MQIPYEQVYDLIRTIRDKANDEELEVDEAFELLEKELNQIEYENF